MSQPKITDDIVVTSFESNYLNVFDLQYAEGRHYYDATRRKRENLVALKSDEDYKNMVSDAVSCVVIVESKAKGPRLLLAWEFRYPTGHMVLGVPAGLIDPRDYETDNPVIHAAIREIKEETGVTVDESMITVVNPLLFSTPGMTDESNAIVCVRIPEELLAELDQGGAEDSEYFDGFELLTKEDVKKLLTSGLDPAGNYYSVYTWVALAWFSLVEG